MDSGPNGKNTSRRGESMMILKAVNRQLRQKVIFITKLVLVLSVVLVNQGCSWQARKEPVKTEVVQEPSLSVTTISEEVFRDDDYITEIPIRWSRDSADLYYITYQSDESVPLEIWKFDGKKRKRSHNWITGRSTLITTWERLLNALHGRLQTTCLDLF